MQSFEITQRSPLEASADLLAIPVVGRPAPGDPVIGPLEKTLGVDLGALADEELFEGKPDQQLALLGRDRVPAKRILLVGTDPAAPAYLRLRTFATAALRYALALNLRRVAIVVTDVGRLDPESWIEALAMGTSTGTYRFAQYLTGDRKPRSAVDAVAVCVGRRVRVPPKAALARATALAQATAAAVRTARDWVNEPPNVLTPSELARRATAAARRAGLEVRVWGLPEIKKRGLALLAAVNQGCREPARFIQIRYRPRRPSKRRIVIVGKGLTFDAGGFCIKQPKNMLDMKCDMAGGATVIATMTAVAARRPASEVIALVPATENLISGTAMRPGDVVRSFTGKTVEIVNTDAEGRLILADTLGYACTLRPSVIIDHATLTGACLVALGPYAAGLFSTSDDEAKRFLRAAARTGEQYWRLPLAEDMKEHIKSEVADVKNIGEAYGGAIAGALFLQHFVDSVPWIHVDIAGPAYLEKATAYAPRGGTGFGIPTLLRYIEQE